MHFIGCPQAPILTRFQADLAQQFTYGQPGLENDLWVCVVEAQRYLPAIEFCRVRQDVSSFAPSLMSAGLA